MNASDTLISMLDNHAKTHPDKLAYTFLAENGKTALTNYELWKKVTALATHLLVKVKTESRAILLLPPGLDYIVAFLGCLRAGVIVVPAYPLRNNRHMQRLLAVIHDARAEVVITTSAFAHQYPIANILTLEIDNMLSQAYSEPLPDITQNQLAFLQYTSGSTGSPKGVMISHGNIMANANLIDSLLAGNCKTVCSWLPPFHDMGLIGAILYPLYKNIHSILMAPTTFLKRPFLWLKAISDYKADVSPAPNFAYEMCAKKVTEAEKKELDLSHWLVALNGAEPVNAQTLIKFSTAFASCGFRAGSCYPAYGMAEATLMVSGKKPGDNPVVLEVDKQALQTRHHLVLDTRGEKVNVVSCGHTAASHEIKIINPKTKKLLPSYKIGEIVVAGPSITQGYWGKPTLTKKIFALQLPHSNKKFLRTGDLGFTDEKGQLFITGRLKDLIIIQGQNIYPQDIEQAVTESHPALIEHGSAAFLVDFNGEPELIVVQEVHRSAKNFEVIFTAILKRCAEDFAILPTQITLIQQATLPKTSSGKVQRNACRNALLKGDLKVVKEWKQVSRKTATVTQLMVASHELQSWMQQWFAERLNLTIQQLDTKTNFAYYGVDAGIAVQFCAALEKHLNRSINPGLLWSYSTIEELTEYLLTNCTSSQADSVNQYSILKQSFEPIAIVGMSCRLPGGIKTPEQFWKFLQAGKNGITDTPDKRWDIEQYYNFSSVTADKMLKRKGGFIDDAERFDVNSLNISRRDLAAMEPQYQLLLQLIGEALESADIVPFTISNSDTTLFVGISTKDSYPHLVSDSLHQSVNGYHKPGNWHRAAVGKIAYLLGTQGPALAIDTACSSSLVAVLNACQSLQDDICNLAIVGGVNTLLEPTLNLHVPNIDMLSLQGKCRVFDKEADGYVRSEGCGVLILKRLRDATQQGDKIMAVIKSAAVNSDGRHYEDARFDSKVQKELLSKALSLAGLSADDLGYIEAHGTGILLADSTEFDALRQVFATGKRQNPLYIGSVKSNLGHLEAAAGMAGLIKTVLMLQNKQIPPNLHFKTVNPFIELDTIPAKIPIQLEPWKTPGTNIRYAGISAFGFTGINVHLILTEIP